MFVRWLSLIAVVTGCTLITDPDSLEGDGSDAGMEDVPGDTSTDSTSDGDPPPEDTGADASCTEDDITTLRICNAGVYEECDADGDEFVRLGPECAVFDAERGFPPPDCDDEDAEASHGLPSCSSPGMLRSCVMGINDVLDGTQPGEIAFPLHLLSGEDAPPSPELAFVGRGLGAYDVYYGAECEGMGCQELRKITFTYQPGWRFEITDQDIRPNSAPMGPFISIRASGDADSVALAVMVGNLVTQDWVGLYNNDFMVAPRVEEARIRPGMAVSARGDTGRLFWQEGVVAINATLHMLADEPDPSFSPVRRLTEINHPMDAAGSYVVLLGDSGEQQFWAAPPLADAIDSGVCAEDTGCQPVRVGASQTSATDLRPNGPPTVVVNEAGVATGIFPVMRAAAGDTPQLTAQMLRAGCEEVGGTACTMPALITGTSGSNGLHDSAAVGEEVLVAYPIAGEIFLARFMPPNLDGTPVETDPQRLFNDGLVDRFTRVEAIRIWAQQDGPTTEVAVLVLGVSADAGGERGLYLDIVRTCN